MDFYGKLYHDSYRTKEKIFETQCDVFVEQMNKRLQNAFQSGCKCTSFWMGRSTYHDKLVACAQTKMKKKDPENHLVFEIELDIDRDDQDREFVNGRNFNICYKD